MHFGFRTACSFIMLIICFNAPGVTISLLVGTYRLLRPWVLSFDVLFNG